MVVRLLKGKKGMSLIEIIVAIAVLGIISVPITTSFMNSMKTTHSSQEQMEFNSAIRIAKGAVVDSIMKSSGTIPVINNMPVTGFDNYIYDADFGGKSNFNAGELIICTITVKDKAGTVKRKIKLEIDTNK